MKTNIVKFFTHKVTIGFFAFFLGIGSFWGFEKLNAKTKRSNLQSWAAPMINIQNDDLFSSEDLLRDFDPFKNQSSIFKHMDKWHQQMLKDFESFDPPQKHFWSGWTTTKDTSVALKKKEDTDAVYFELETGKKVPKNFEVKVDQNQMTISGTVEEGDGKTMSSTSSFVESFPVPQNVMADKYEVKNEPGKIVVRLPKVKNDQAQGQSQSFNGNI